MNQENGDNMYYGAIYQYDNSEEIEGFQFDACFSNFLNHGYKKKYLYALINPYPQFTLEEVKYVLGKFKKHFKFKIINHSFEKDTKFFRRERTVTFKSDIKYPLIKIYVQENSIVKIKIFYHLFRYFHESDTQIQIMRDAIELKKTLKRENFINLILFCSAYHSPHYMGHSFSNGYSKFVKRSIDSILYIISRGNIFVSPGHGIPSLTENMKQHSTIEDKIKLYKEL